MLLNQIKEVYGNKIRIRVCGLLTDNDRILLVKQKLNTDSTYFWSPPGGGIEFGESIKECLKREFLEETGLEVSIENFYTLYEYISPPLHSIELYYRVKIIAGELKKGFDPEMSDNTQTIQDCSFINYNSIVNSQENSFHPILFQYISKK